MIRGGALRVRVTDAGAGVDPRTLVARVDGVRRGVRFAGGIATVDVRGLRRGRHALRFEASDYQEAKNMENVPRILPNTRVLSDLVHDPLSVGLHVRRGREAAALQGFSRVADPRKRIRGLRNKSAPISLVDRGQALEVALDARRELLALGADEPEMRLPPLARPPRRDPLETEPLGEARPLRGHEDRDGRAEQERVDPAHARRF